MVYVPALALTIAAIVTIAPWGPFRASLVMAHCPGTTAHDYAAGGVTLASAANGVKGTISWTQGNVCTSGVSHSVTVCGTGSCGHWAQVGWRYYNGYAEPKMYCEWAGSQYKIVEFSITHAALTYKQDYDKVDKTWDCYQDSTFKYTYSLASAGFSSGTYLVAQGENHQAHVQIGLMTPGKLMFQEMQYQRSSDSAWLVMNVNVGSPVAPYGADEPAAGQMRVWTNAH